MPSADKHQNQHLHNMKLLDSETFSMSDEFSDWFVTILFYGALHLIEREIAKAQYRIDNHTERLKWVSRTVPLNRIKDDFNVLYFQSRRARYDCARFKPKDIEGLKKHYSNIEKLLNPAS